MHASLGRVVQSDLLAGGRNLTELAPQPENGRGQDLGDLGEALRDRELIDRPAHGVDPGGDLQFRSPGERDLATSMDSIAGAWRR